jgi:CheY-like chemotaxis protein
VFLGIVEMHGGTVRATSEGEGHGCTFILELPLYSEDENRRDTPLPARLDTELEEFASPGGAGHALQATVAPRNPPVVAKPGRSVLGGIFRAKRSFQAGANYFLNQKVKFKFNRTPSRERAMSIDAEDSAWQAARNCFVVNEGAVGALAESEDIAWSDKSWWKDLPFARLRASLSVGKKSRTPSISAVVPGSLEEVAYEQQAWSGAPLDEEGDFGSTVESPAQDNELIDLESQDTHLQSYTAPARAPARRDWSCQLRFLAVDDTALNRKMMSRLLRAAGHAVDEAEDGLECLAALHCSAEGPPVPLPGVSASGAAGLSQAYDAVLIDENMPNMSGPEAVQRLRECGYKGLVIGVTGDCYQDQMDRFVAQGANAVLPKPLKVDLLRAKLEELWRKSELK